jgi:Kef-type K+ transport system membrane component KefB
MCKEDLEGEDLCMLAVLNISFQIQDVETEVLNTFNEFGLLFLMFWVFDI